MPSSSASSPHQEPGFEAGAHDDPHKESHSAHQKFSLIMIIPFNQWGSLWKPVSLLRVLSVQVLTGAPWSTKPSMSTNWPFKETNPQPLTSWNTTHPPRPTGKAASAGTIPQGPWDLRRQPPEWGYAQLQRTAAPGSWGPPALSHPKQSVA